MVTGADMQVVARIRPRFRRSGQQPQARVEARDRMAQAGVEQPVAAAGETLLKRDIECRAFALPQSVAVFPVNPNSANARLRAAAAMQQGAARRRPPARQLPVTTVPMPRTLKLRSMRNRNMRFSSSRARRYFVCNSWRR